MNGMKRWGWTVGLVTAVALTGCDRGGSDTTEAKPDKKTKGSADDERGDTKRLADEVEEEPATETAAAPPPPVEPGKEATPFIGKKSKAPSTAEWDAQTKEVTVHGSSARMCETKMVREWLRISCRGEPAGYGQAQTVTVLSGGGRGDEGCAARSRSRDAVYLPYAARVAVCLPYGGVGGGAGLPLLAGAKLQLLSPARAVRRVDERH